MLRFFINLFRSFPVQLLLLHLRSNLMLLLTWGILLALITGALGQFLGFQFLFLDPEYLGSVSFVSFLLMGLTFGFFVMSWNLTTYLLTARFFGFLACLARPFLKFSINNALLPLFVLGIYTYHLYDFNADFRSGTSRFWLHWLGLIAGLVLSLLLYMLYFYLTNRDIYYYTGRRPAPPNVKVLQPFGRQIGHSLDAVQRRENPYHVRSYLSNSLKTRLVRSVAHYDRSTLEEVYRQNHWNALFLQFITLAALILLGLLIDSPVFQLPAGASIFIFFSFFIFFIGAVSYWFQEWRLTILMLFLILINWVTSLDFFQRSNYAYGINYEKPDAPYNENRLAEIVSGDQPRLDSLANIEMLENWKARQADSLPPLVVVCASGGGLTAAVWTIQIVQRIERVTAGRFMPSTVLMTGASGGMLGLAYLREVYRRRGEDSTAHLSPTLLNRAAADLLNPLAFSIVSNDIFLPLTEVEIGDESYLRDRAYSFERAFDANTEGLLDLPLSAYRAPEMRAEIPQMILTPSIVNDGRRLLISPLGSSHLMTTSVGKNKSSALTPDAVDLGALLGDQQRDSLRFLTALRMNATYPYVLPFVHLPTRPTVRVMDAGYRDNYGILTAGRFVQVFEDWIKANTSKVIFIQISTYLGEEKMASLEDNQGLLESLFAPIGLAGNFTNVQSQEQDNTLGYLYELLGPDRFELLRFNYVPDRDAPVRASVSFHLTEPEKEEVLRAGRSAEVEGRLRELVEVFE